MLTLCLLLLWHQEKMPQISRSVALGKVISFAYHCSNLRLETFSTSVVKLRDIIWQEKGNDVTTINKKIVYKNW